MLATVVHGPGLLSRVLCSKELRSLCCPHPWQQAAYKCDRMQIVHCLTTSQADFSPRCRENLAGQQPARLADWRLDHNLRTACKADVPQHCSDELRAKEPQVLSAWPLQPSCVLWAWVGATCVWVRAPGCNAQGHAPLKNACNLWNFACVMCCEWVHVTHPQLAACMYGFPVRQAWHVRYVHHDGSNCSADDGRARCWSAW